MGKRETTLQNGFLTCFLERCSHWELFGKGRCWEKAEAPLSFLSIYIMLVKDLEVKVTVQMTYL